MATSRSTVQSGASSGGNTQSFMAMASELSGAARSGGKSRAAGSRAGAGGNPSSYLDLAEDLFSARSAQGKGKTVEESASFAKAGSPKEFLAMASELRRNF